MLTREQKEKLRHLSYSQFFLTEQNGVPLDIRNNQPVKIPDFSELQECVFREIRKLGFNEISRVIPWRANLIVRLFYKRHYQSDYPEIHNLYGYRCYARSGLSWVTGSQENFNPSKFVFRVWFFQDEYINYDCNFVDFYLKIK